MTLHMETSFDRGQLDALCAQIENAWEEREDQNIVCETVHRTKGLEFDAVIFATTSATVKDELLYVGASRAVSLLTVIAPLPVAERLGIA